MSTTTRQLRHIIFDIHGVLLGLSQSAQQITKQTLAILRNAGYPLRFLTNSSSLEKTQLLEELGHFGIAAQADEIFTAAMSVAMYLESLAQPLRVYVVGSQTLRQELDRVCGKQLTWVAPEDADVVVVSRDPSLDDALLLRLGSNHHALLVATCRDDFFADQQGTQRGPGECVTRVERVMQRSAFVVGKPNPFVLTHVMKLSPAELEQSVIVGDSLEQDITLASLVNAESVFFHCQGPAELPPNGPKPRHVIAEMNELLKLVGVECNL